MVALDAQVLEELKLLAAKHRIERLVLFGSRARGDYQRTSDVDLAVCGGDIAAFSIDVEEETSTLLFFDIVDLGLNVQAELLDSIEKEGVLLYEKI